MSSRGNSNIWRLKNLVNQRGMHHSRPWCFQMSPVFCLGLFTWRKYLVSFQSQLIKLHFLFLRSSQLWRTEQSLPKAHWLLIVMVPFLSSLGENVRWLRFYVFLHAWKSQILSFFLFQCHTHFKSPVLPHQFCVQLSYLFMEQKNKDKPLYSITAFTRLKTERLSSSGLSGVKRPFDTLYTMGGSEVCYCTFPQARIKLHKYTRNPDLRALPLPFFLCVCALMASWAPCGSPWCLLAHWQRSE